MIRKLVLSVLLISVTAGPALSTGYIGHVWSKQFGNADYEFVSCAETNPSGGVVIAGTFRGAVDFGGGSVDAGTYADIFVVQYDRDGNYDWFHHFGGELYMEPGDLACDDGGYVYVVGQMCSGVDLSAPSLQRTSVCEVIIKKYDKHGSAVWSRVITGSDNTTSGGIAVDIEGNIYITGWFSGDTNLGGSLLTSAGGNDMFLLKLDSAGNHVWSTSFGDAGSQRGTKITTDDLGGVTVAGIYTGAVDFGDGQLPAESGDGNVFVTRFNATGDCIWSHGFGDTELQEVRDIGVDAAGNTYITGFFRGTVDFGTGVLVSAGGEDIFLAKFTTNGSCEWSHRYGDSSWEQFGLGISVSPDGWSAITGDFVGILDFPNPTVSSGSADVFVALFKPNGDYSGSRQFGSANYEGGRAVAINRSGGIFVAGEFHSSIDFGGGSLISAGGSDIFLVKLDRTWAANSAGIVGDDGPGIGVACPDYDGDGDHDLYITNLNAGNILLRNDGGTAFSDATSGIIGDTGPGYGSCWGDYDNDGDPDVYIAQYGAANKLFRNMGGGVFTDASVSPVNHSGNGKAVAWVDYNGDTMLDIYLGNTGASGYNKLFAGINGLWFSDESASPVNTSQGTQCMAWADYDNDGDQDVYITNWNTENRLFQNDGAFFTDVTSGPLGDTGAGQGVAWGDYDNDGDFDLYFANAREANKLLRNDGDGVFTDVTTAPLDDPGVGIGVGWGDYDNDGDLDLYLTNEGQANRLFRNDGGGSFVDITSTTLGDTGYGRAVAWADLDEDGDLDLYLVNSNSSNRLYWNFYPPGNHWLHVDLVATQSNRSAIGARAEVVTGSKRQIREVSAGSGYLAQESSTLEFGLGSDTHIDTVVVSWPSGFRQICCGIAVDQRITITEISNPEPIVAAVSDVPSDPGRQIRVTFAASEYDSPNPGVPILQYEFYRRIDTLPAGSVESVMDRTSGRQMSADLGPALAGWEYVGSIPAHGDPSYTAILPTLADSTITSGMHWSVYFVRAATANPVVFFDSAPDSGYSLDELAPSAPQGLFLSDEKMLSWEPCAEDDVEHYTVYGVAEDPGTGEITTQTLGTTSVEQYDVSAYSDFINYLVTATDDAGNEGDPGDLGQTPVGTGRTPEVSQLSIGAYPNPFNPETVIRYSLPEDGPVRIVIYGVSGEFIRELVSGNREKGTHTIRWNGTNRNGVPVASGVFVARIETDNRVKTTKLVLLK